jgi:hypothetical protein
MWHVGMCGKALRRIECSVVKIFRGIEWCWVRILRGIECSDVGFLRGVEYGYVELGAHLGHGAWSTTVGMETSRVVDACISRGIITGRFLQGDIVRDDMAVGFICVRVHLRSGTSVVGFICAVVGFICGCDLLNCARLYVYTAVPVLMGLRQVSLWVIVGHCGSLWVIVGHCGCWRHCPIQQYSFLHPACC